MHPLRHAASKALWILAASLSCVTTAMPAAAEASAPPQAFDVVYRVKTGGVAAGSMHRRFEIDATGDYRFTSIIEAEGLVALLKPTRIEESSIGTWTADQPQAQRYAHRKKSGKKIKETTLTFDWNAGLAAATVNGTKVDSPVTSGTLDKLNYQLALMRDLAAGATTLSYRVADVGATKDYVLALRPAERVQAAGKQYDTVPVAYSRSDGRRTVLWCAAALGYLPVRIEYTEKDGGVTTAVMSSVSP